ncbi:MAG TPA: hypothetical protein VNX40_00550 [Mucilaginibacter sp.]|nr:hypothetical protein [Mucilaginibacter sp.]
MRNTILIQLINPKAIGILRELEELQLIKILKEDVPPKSNLSDKYRGVFSKKDAQNFNEYTMKMRKEWGNT